MAKKQKYPWISFEVDLSLLPISVWVQLGACSSKCEHISRVPLKPLVRERLHKVYLAKGARATTSIEGNTLTEEEVRLLIDKKLELPPSKEYLGIEVDNIIRLCNEIGNDIVQGKEQAFSVERICQYNHIILNKIPLHDEIIRGKLRKHDVGVGPYKAPHWEDVPDLMDKLCEWLNSSYFQSGLDSCVESIIKAMTNPNTSIVG